MSEQCHMMGLVIRVKREKDVVLTLLTAEQGRVTVIAKGARSLKGPQMAVSQLLCYADFELYRRGDLYWLRTGEVIETFPGIGRRLDALNLAAYLCDVAYAASEAGEGAGDLLRLTLNSLHFLSNRSYPDTLIKGVFEWRVLALAGLSPSVGACADCGREQDNDFMLDIAAGELLCGSCRSRRIAAARREDEMPVGGRVPISAGAVEAIRFALSTPPARMMSFRLPDEGDQQDFSRAGGEFLRYHLDIDSPALHMYEQMRRTGPS